MGYIFLFIIVLLIMLLIFIVLSAVFNKLLSMRWEKYPDPSGKMVDAGGHKLYIHIHGESGPAVVIFTWGGGPSCEWWHIQDELAKTTTVVTLDRAGYGWSETGPFPRTSARIVEETHRALQNAGIKPPYVLVGHSQGGYYVDYFCRQYPSEVVGAALLDSLSLDNKRWYIRFPTYKSYYDKSQGLKMGRLLAALGLVRLFKMEAYPRIPAEIKRHVNEHYSRPDAFNTFYSESVSSVLAGEEVKSIGPFPPIPLKIVYPSPEVNMKNWIDYGVDATLTKEMESLHEELAREMLAYSPKSEWIVAEKSTHAMHLDEPDFLIDQIKDLVIKAREGI